MIIHAGLEIPLEIIAFPCLFRVVAEPGPVLVVERPGEDRERAVAVVRVSVVVRLQERIQEKPDLLRGEDRVAVSRDDVPGVDLFQVGSFVRAVLRFFVRERRKRRCLDRDPGLFLFARS